MNRCHLFRPVAKPKISRQFIVALQALVSLCLLGALFSGSGFRGEIFSVLRSADLRWLLGGFLLAGAVQFLCLVRWRIFLRISGIEIRFMESASIFFAGLFCNLFLPGGAGGDVVKIGLLAARGKDVGRSTISVLMDRLCGSVSMIVLGGFLMSWQFSWLSKSPVVTGLVNAVVMYLVVVSGLIGLSVLLSARGIVTRLPERWPGRARFVELAGVYFQCAVKWKATLRAIGISLLMLALFFLTYYFSGRAFSVNISALKFLALMPTVDILSGLPVSLNGVGVRENLFVFLLGNLASVSPPVAVSISLSGYLMSALWGIPGAFFWLVKPGGES